MGLFTPSQSPAITVREIDLTGVAPNVETSLAGFVGDFQWGPVNEVVRVPNEAVLIEKYGQPKATNATDFLTASQFLRYSQNLLLCRVINSGGVDVGDSAFNASSGITSAQVLNADNFEAQKATLSSGSAGTWIAKYPGEVGNSLAVSILPAMSTLDSSTTIFESWLYASEFSGAPSTSTWADGRSGTITNDEVHVAVIDEDGRFSGTKGTVLETFQFLSVAKGAKTSEGSTNYIGDVINRASEYIWFGGFDSANTVFGDNWGSTIADSANEVVNFGEGVEYNVSLGTNSLSGGTDTLTLDAGDISVGFDQFEDADQVDVQILIAPGMASAPSQIAVVNDMVGIAKDTRKDCIVVTSPNRDAVVNSTSPVADTIAMVDQFTSSNYLVVDNNYFYVYDKFNDQYVYIPAASSTAGLMAATDANFGPWYSPAGLKRGQYSGVAGLAYSANKSERDELYKRGVNPIVQLPGQGTLLFGDKTKESRPSAFDRINVRRLFLAIEKSIANAARNVMFEFNDEFTRAEFVGVIEPVLREIQARRGIQDFLVQCDERNNTAAVIDRNELIATIFIKPARSINYVTLNFVAVRTGVSFEEVVGTV
jgi:hypothetical protein